MVYLLAQCHIADRQAAVSPSQPEHTLEQPFYSNRPEVDLEVNEDVACNSILYF